MSATYVFDQPRTFYIFSNAYVYFYFVINETCLKLFYNSMNANK